MLNCSASLSMSTSVLEALPGKLDIKRHSPSILYISASLAMSTSVLKALPGKLDIKRLSPSILYELVSLPASDNAYYCLLWKKFGHRSGLKFCLALSWSILFDTLMVSLTIFWEKSMQSYPALFIALVNLSHLQYRLVLYTIRCQNCKKSNLIWVQTVYLQFENHHYVMIGYHLCESNKKMQLATSPDVFFFK